MCLQCSIRTLGLNLIQILRNSYICFTIVSEKRSKVNLSATFLVFCRKAPARCAAPSRIDAPVAGLVQLFCTRPPRTAYTLCPYPLSNRSFCNAMQISCMRTFQFTFKFNCQLQAKFDYRLPQYSITSSQYINTQQDLLSTDNPVQPIYKAAKEKPKYFFFDLQVSIILDYFKVTQQFCNIK